MSQQSVDSGNMLTMNRPPRTRREQLLRGGEWLAAQRDTVGLSQKELGRLIGKSYQSVSSYERGVSAPDDDTCEKIARALSVTAAEVRSQFGKYVPSGMSDEAPPEPPSVLSAILADPNLIPEAKEHLTRQYGLLLRLAVVSNPQADAEALGRELEHAEEVESGLSRHKRDDNHGAR